jgi:transposase
VEGNTLVDTFQNSLLPFQQMYLKEGFYYFIHDNATPHVKGKLTDFIKDNYMSDNILKHPSKSPDINPIEKVWGLLKDRVYGRNSITYYDRRVLKKKIKEEC